MIIRAVVPGEKAVNSSPLVSIVARAVPVINV
jgi:hypothetical protein